MFRTESNHPSGPDILVANVTVALQLGAGTDVIHRRGDLERKTTYTSQEVSDLTGATPRQLQWWDEQGVVTPVQIGHKRLYTTFEALQVSLIIGLREKRMSLQKTRQILQNLSSQHGTNYFDLHRRRGNIHLLTDGEAVYLENSLPRIVEIFSESEIAMICLPLAGVIARLKLPETPRIPVQRETASARRGRADKAS